jgi:hypothetical protein
MGSTSKFKRLQYFWDFNLLRSTAMRIACALLPQVTLAALFWQGLGAKNTSALGDLRLQQPKF